MVSWLRRARRWAGLAAAIALVPPLLVVAGALPATAAAPKALINGDTVFGSPSTEQQQAEALGFAVTVVTGSQWDAMTQSQFAAYQLLIIGDPDCGDLAPSATSNAATWAPVVMGKAVHTTAGNRTLIGTDPVFHQGGHPGATKLIHDGLAFAGALSGRTGVYFDASCFDSTHGTIPTLERLSSGAGSWTENTSPPCGGSVAKIASNPAFDDLHSSDLQGWECSDHETFPTFRDDWSALAVATDTPTHPVCGNDADTGARACGEPYILVAGAGVIVSSPDISLSPKESTNPVGTDHTVTATVTHAGSPSAGQLVSFSVSGQNDGATGTCVPADCKTDANGHVSFTYHDGKGAGDDTITASFTAGGTKEQASAVKHWTTSTTTDPPITASGTTFDATEGASFTGTVATFTDPDATATASEYSATIRWGDGTAPTKGTITGPTGGPFSVHGTHTYAEESTFTVTVTITDKDNTANADAAHSTARVADAPISARCTAPSSSQQSFNGTLAQLTDADPQGTASDYTATVDWGDGGSSAGTISGPLGGPFTVSGTHTYASTGSFTIKVDLADAGGSKGSTSCSILIYAFPAGGHTFVIGDQSASGGGTVTFWGSQWWKRNAMSQGRGSAAFKGFADEPVSPTCGAAWSAAPGNSSGPPSGPLPAYMAVIVTSSADQSRSTTSGTIIGIVIVKTDTGYRPDPGHPGTGIVVGRVC